MANIQLPGGIVLITGAASGIGKETALAFAEAGVEGILLADLNEPTEATIAECQRFSKNPNFRALTVQTDITDEASVAKMVETAVKQFGRVDYCVHAAGMGSISGARTEHLNIEVFDKTFGVNARGTMLVLRAVSAAMAQQGPRNHQSYRHPETTRSLGRGSIVVVSSINGNIAAQGMMAYSASKFAGIGIAKSAAVDNVENHIRVNTICPSWVDTPMMQASIKRFPPLEKMIENVSPLRRAALPEEVADLAVFLSSPSASYVNGSSLVVDAGLTLPALRNSM
ncbi:hypothetical protein BDV06DRAFT_216419 [Aspergillus oleicola]